MRSSAFTFIKRHSSFGIQANSWRREQVWLPAEKFGS
jgi:hypothetical protein